MLKEKLIKSNKVMPYEVPEFAQNHPDLLFIVCDPKTDAIFVGHKGEMVLGNIKSADGKKMQIVKSVLDHSQFAGSINHFITGLLEALQLPLKAGNLFYQFIDGALFNISKALRKEPKPMKGAVKTPFVDEFVGRNNS